MTLLGTRYSNIDNLILFLLFNIIALLMNYKERFTADRKFQVLFSILLFSAAHWFIFPGQKERYLAVFFLFVIVSLLISARQTIPPFDDAALKA